MSEPVNRRQDEGQRSRVDEIGNSYLDSIDAIKAWLKRVVALITIISLVGLVQTPIFYSLLQGQRLKLSRESCLARDEQTDSTIRLLIRLHAHPAAIQSARKEYPRESDCEHYAQARTSSVLGITLLAGKPTITPKPPELTSEEIELCGKECVR